LTKEVFHKTDPVLSRDSATAGIRIACRIVPDSHAGDCIIPGLHDKKSQNLWNCSVYRPLDSDYNKGTEQIAVPIHERLCQMFTRGKTAFTLIELLVVISIIAMLLSIMTPSLRKAREQGKRAVCLANLRAIGMGLHAYALGNDDELVPSDSRVSWEAWGEPFKGPGCPDPSAPGSCRQVNLGHLVATTDIIPVPSGKEHVFFCPSGKGPNGGRTRQEFEKQWGRNNGHAATSYMYNDSLDGIDDYVQSGKQAVLSHVDVVQYVLGDASAHSYRNRPVVYDPSVGPERLQDVARRYGVCFPTALLHEWLAEDRIDMDEARAFLSDPTGWASNYQGQTSAAIALAGVPNVALASDVVGVWGGATPNPPSG